MRLPLVPFVLVAACVSGAARAESPWYLSGSAGAYFREDRSGATTITSGTVTAPGTNRTTFDPGPIVNAALGYKLPLNFRIEGELGYAHYRPEKVEPVSRAFPTLDGREFNRESGGDYNRYTATVNVFYDLPLGETYVPYVGAGIGYAHADATTAQFVSATGARFRQFGSSDEEGVVLAEGGVAIAVDPSWSIVPAYRYLRYFSTSDRFGDEEAHIFKLGVRYSF